jgi:hypothetical protein
MKKPRCRRSWIKNSRVKAVRNYGEAFRSRNVILLCAQYLPGASACTVCAVAAVDYPQRRRKYGHGGSGLALIRAVSGGDHRHDRRLLGVG